jgi:hypothetical protein
MRVPARRFLPHLEQIAQHISAIALALALLQRSDTHAP